MGTEISFNEELKKIIDTVRTANKKLSTAMLELDVLMEQLLKE